MNIMDQGWSPEEIAEAVRKSDTSNRVGMLGVARVTLWRPVAPYMGSNGPGWYIANRQTVKNLITDAGDLYYATRGASAVAPAAPADATKMTGMKLGTGTTAVAKNGAGAALVTYLTASNLAFQSTFPIVNNLGAGLGVEIEYKTTWNAGVSTNSALTEAVIVNDSTTNLTSSAANTIARITFTALDKQAADVLVIDWKHKFLGA